MEVPSEVEEQVAVVHVQYSLPAAAAKSRQSVAEVVDDVVPVVNLVTKMFASMAEEPEDETAAGDVVLQNVAQVVAAAAHEFVERYVLQVEERTVFETESQGFERVGIGFDKFVVSEAAVDYGESLAEGNEDEEVVAEVVE